MRLPPLSLVIGGTSSGKSAFAEGFVRQSGLTKIYLATAEARDPEMLDKIAAHRAGREGEGWRTVEEPRDVVAVISELTKGEVLLFDCITLWLTNLMINEDDWQRELARLTEAIARCPAPIVAVTNDVSGGVVPANTLARAFQRVQGRVNQHLAGAAGLVVQVTAGLPHVLKGKLEGVCGDGSR